MLTRCLCSRRTHLLSGFVRAVVPMLVVACAAVAARADDFIDRVNAAYKSIPEANRSDLVILPAVAKLQPAPAEMRSVDFNMLVTPSHAAWGTIEAWVTAEPQKAMLKALHDVTREEDFRKAMVFAQGYGVEAVSNRPDLLSAEMYTELGDPPTLAGARHLYLPAIGRLLDLCNIEATRLLAAGNAKGAIDVMFDCLYFYRQLSDRPFLMEKRMGLMGMRMSLHRIRDIAYQDSRSDKKSLTVADIKAWVKRLEPEKGYVGVGRLRLPEANLIAAEQLVNRVMVKGQGINDSFSSALARITGGTKPLRILSESAYWDNIAKRHAGYYDTLDQLIGKQGDGGIRADWNRLWGLDPFDPLLRRESAISMRIKSTDRFAVLRVTLDGIDDLFPMRQSVRTEISGTRLGLSAYGSYIQSNGSWPRDITAVRPTFVEVVDLDPYNTAKKPFEYFVPMRDRPPQGIRGEEVPFELRVWPGVGRKNFSLKLKADQFVIYSVGPNDVNDAGKDATQGDPQGDGDYLIWPPALSLIRKNLQDSGQQP